MGPKTEELICVLDKLIAVLESDGEEHWSMWFRKARRCLLNSDYSGISAVLLAYGGMGSFNDLILGQSSKDGAFCWKAGYFELNEKLEELRSDAVRLANEIKRSQ